MIDPVISQLKSTASQTKSRIEKTLHSYRKSSRSKGVRFAVAESIGMLNPEPWDILTQNSSIFLKRKYLQLLEKNAPENLHPYYAILYWQDQPVAAVVAQSVDISAALLPKPFRARTTALQAAERSLKQIKERVLVCGNLLSWGAFHGVAFLPGIDPATLWAGVEEVFYRIQSAGDPSSKPGVILIKDLPDGYPLDALAKLNYRPFNAGSNMVLSLDPSWLDFNGYLQALRSNYRSPALKVRKDCENAGISVESLAAPEVAEHADEIFELYHQVHDAQMLRLVTIQKSYIPALAAAFGENFRTQVAWNRERRMVGFVTCMKDANGTIGYYIGFDKFTAADAPIYLRLLQCVIEDAIRMRASWINLGRTALQPKAQLGAKPLEFQCLVRHRMRAVNVVLQSLLHVLPEPEHPPVRNPFK